MSSNKAATEAALLAVAKDLLQASDDLASTDPSASAKLAHEAYEIGRDLGIVRNHLDDPVVPSPKETQSGRISAFNPMMPNSDMVSKVDSRPSHKTSYRRHSIEDDADAELSRILDRQKAMLPAQIEAAPVRKPSRDTRSLTFEATPSRRSSWFGWMRPREWRHAG